MSPELERLIGNRKKRRVVIETIAAAEQPFSARQLCEMVKSSDPTISRMTIYRTLRLLREHQVIRMTVLQTSKRVFHMDLPLIFLICDNCSRISSLSSDEICGALRLFAEARGFHSVKITVEVRSPCEEMQRSGFCSQNSSAAKKKKDGRCRVT